MSGRALAMVAALSLCAVARADEPSAPSLFRRGVEALRAQDYAAAAAAFQQSYALSPKAATVCNLALTYDRWAGHVAEAVESYRKCAEDDASGRFRDHALERARQLREQLAAPPPPPPAVEPKPTPKGGPRPEPMAAPPVEKAPPPVEKAPPPVEKAPPPVEKAPPLVERALPPAEKAPPLVVAQPPPAPAPRTRSFFKDPAACTLTFLGVAGVASGVGLVVAGKLDDNNVAKTVDLGQKTTLYDRAGVLVPAGYVALGVGVALVVAGVVEWAAHGRHAAPPTGAARAAWRF